MSWCVALIGAEPKLKEATLEWRGHVLSPARVTTPWLPEYRVGTNLIVLSNANLSALNPTDYKARWTNNSPDARELHWLAATEDVAYLQSFQANRRGSKPESNPKIMRMDLRSGNWLANLTIPEDSGNDIVLDVSTRKNLVIVLSASLGADGQSEDRFTGYRVSCFIEPDGKMVWSKSFTTFPEQRAPGAFLLSASRPNAAVANIRHVSFLRDDILICAGPRQPLMRLSSKTGETQWSIERIWEFERGFIGPSVWNHFISRFGNQEWPGDKNQADPALTRTFSNRWECNIIGGPVVVTPKPSDSRYGRKSHVFIAVSKASAEQKKGAWASYLSDCIIYELNDDGEPLTMMNLPRLVDGSRVTTKAEAIIWNCQNNAVAKLQASDYDQLQIGMGPGGPDGITKLNWYREFDSPQREEWLTTDKAGDPVTFAATGMFRVLSGGYVSSSDVKVFNLPLTFIDYTTATTEQIRLRVPLDDSVPIPATNIRSSGHFHHALGPYFLAITGLKADGDELAITLGMEKWSGIVTFRLQGGK